MIDLLAASLERPRRSLRIVSGARARHKRVLVAGVTTITKDFGNRRS